MLNSFVTVGHYNKMTVGHNHFERRIALLLNKREEKKVQKRELLMDAGYELFLKNGVNDVSISEITRKAGTAKGTFYLYFKDKYDLLNSLVLFKSSQIMSKAIEASVHLPEGSVTDRALFVVDYVIEFMKTNKDMLKLIDKNLSWGVFVEAIEKDESYSNLKELSKLVLGDFETIGYSQKKAEQVIFIIIEMLGSVCYSSIILEQPAPIDEMKPVIFEMIKKMLD